MAEERQCNECGGKLPADAPEGMCPQCLMKLGLGTGAATEKAGPKDETSDVPTTGTPPGRFVPPEPAELAEQFPQLEILELLGQGGMGAVYKARQKQLDRVVALKILPPEVDQTETFAERFSREARSLARLNHPRIVTVFDFGHTEDGLYYFVMEYVDGTDLRHVIQAGKLEPSEALAIVPQVCEALQFAHEEGIVHRDIKPENILIDKKGRVKIADFGLAKLLDKPATAFTLTADGHRMGTPHYMAPEQIEHPGQVDHRADIYSLGVVFYEMLTGELPIGRFAPPSKKVHVDVMLDEVVLRTLEKEPERRYQQASEVKTDVETINAGSHPPMAAIAPAGQAPIPAPAINRMEKHITIVAVLSLVFGSLWTLFGLILFLVIFGGGLISGDPTAEYITAIVGIAIGGLVILTSVPKIIAGIGLLKRRGWARILALILAVLDLMNIPIGTAIGIYAIWVLLNDETAQLFGQASAGRRVQTQPVDDSPQGIKRRLRVPAVALIVCGVLRCLGLLLLGLSLGGYKAPGPTEATMFLVTILTGGLIIAGAWHMLSLRNYGLAVAGSIVAMLPLGLDFLIGFPFGIWALVVLTKSEVKTAFGGGRTTAAAQTRANQRGVLIGLVVAGVAIVITFLFTLPVLLPMLYLTLSRQDSRPQEESVEIASGIKKIGELAFVYGVQGDLTFGQEGPTLNDRCVLKLNLEPPEATEVNRILRTAQKRYQELEAQHTEQLRSGNSLKVTISPFREEAKSFLEQLWSELDSTLDEEQRDLARKHLPFGYLFGKNQFGQATVIFLITKENGIFTHRTTTEWPDKSYGGVGQSKTLPANLQQFWEPSETEK
ncbi:MAG: serine/threonine-protein kinase [Planctomycetota bacterium]|jgi:tRNA A-37 threonylcarbamoyl transferase component Bud32